MRDMNTVRMKTKCFWSRHHGLLFSPCALEVKAWHHLSFPARWSLWWAEGSSPSSRFPSALSYQSGRSQSGQVCRTCWLGVPHSSGLTNPPVERLVRGTERDGEMAEGRELHRNCVNLPVSPC